jgi:hypothetical protein
MLQAYHLDLSTLAQCGLEQLNNYFVMQYLLQETKLPYNYINKIKIMLFYSEWT